jgi:hypothetical protein
MAGRQGQVVEHLPSLANSRPRVQTPVLAKRPEREKMIFAVFDCHCVAPNIIVRILTVIWAGDQQL